MDADGVDESLEKAMSIDDGSTAQQDLQPDGKGVPVTTGKKSYASMVAGLQDRRSGKEHIGCFDADNITVLEEDNRRQRNTMDIMAQQVNKSNNAITEAVGGSQFASLAGKGTIVDDHGNNLAHVEKHRVEPEAVDIDVSNCNEDEALHPMNLAPMKHVIRNAAYMASNLDKKVKSSKPTAKGINVVSMNNGQAAVVKEKSNIKFSGNHQAIVIEELEGRQPHALGSRSTNLKGVTGLHVDNQDTRQGLHVPNENTMVQDLHMTGFGPPDEQRPNAGQ
ncbi:hypothetical protein V6N13_065800 [Hibiscus sabdariffa]|uniref:Uncharacterized protein n=2 Tax=Hibiscus sabdariffa TaxID=183260 RepID=A0ABR2QPS6_9ROSI